MPPRAVPVRINHLIGSVFFSFGRRGIHPTSIRRLQPATKPTTTRREISGMAVALKFLTIDQKQPYIL